MGAVFTNSSAVMTISPAFLGLRYTPHSLIQKIFEHVWLLLSGTFQGTRDTAMIKTDKNLCICGFYFLEEEANIK